LIKGENNLLKAYDFSSSSATSRFKESNLGEFFVLFEELLYGFMIFGLILICESEVFRNQDDGLLGELTNVFRLQVVDADVQELGFVFEVKDGEISQESEEIARVFGVELGEDFRESSLGLRAVETDLEEGQKEGLHLRAVVGGESTDLADDFIKEISLLDVDLGEGVDNFDEFISSEGGEDSADISKDVVVDGGVSGVEVSESLEGLDNFRGVHSLVEIVVVGDEFSDDGNVEFVVLSDILGRNGLEDVRVQLLVTEVQEALDGLDVQISRGFEELGGESQSGGERVQDSLGTSFAEVLLEGFQLFVDFSNDFFVFNDIGRGSLEDISEDLGASVDTFIGGLGLFVDLSGIFSSEEAVIDQVQSIDEFQIRRDVDGGGFIDFVGLLGEEGSDLRSNTQGFESLDETVDALESDFGLAVFHDGEESEEELVEFSFESVEFYGEVFVILKAGQDLSERNVFSAGVFDDVSEQEDLVNVVLFQGEEDVDQSGQFLSGDSGQVFFAPSGPGESGLLVSDSEEHILVEIGGVEFILLSLQAFSSGFDEFKDFGVSDGGFSNALGELVDSFSVGQDFSLEFSLQVVVFIGFQVGEDKVQLESLVSAHLGETTVFDESVEDGGDVLTVLRKGLEDGAREEGSLDFVDLLNDLVKEGFVFDSSSLVDVQQSFDSLETANVVIIEDSLGDFFVEDEDFVVLDFSSSREVEDFVKEVDQEEGLDVFGVVLDGNDDHFLNFFKQVIGEFSGELSISFQDIINSNFGKLIQDVLELALQGEEDVGDSVAGGVEVQFHSSNVHEDDALLVRVQFGEQLVQVSLDVISNSGFLGGGVASLVRAGLEDLDDGERSEELAITLEFAEDFSSDIIGISIQAREIVEQVDEVSEVERLGLDEISNFAVKLGEVFFRDVGGEFADLESSEPEQEIEDFYEGIRK